MIIAALNNYYKRLAKEDKEGFSKQKISYAIILSKDGEAVDVHDIRDTSGKKPRPKLMSVPQPPDDRNGGDSACFFWDNASYALGISKKQQDKAHKQHATFKKTTLEMIEGSNDKGLVALRNFLQNWSPEQVNKEVFAKHTDLTNSNIVFKLESDSNIFLHDRAAACEAYLSRKNNRDADNMGICLVTGSISSISRTHPFIEGVGGTLQNRAKLVAFDKDSFISFNKKQSANAPISEKVADQYTKALNYLLRYENRRRLSIGDATTVFWAIADNSETADNAESFLSAVLNPKSDDEQAAGELKRFLDTVGKGRPLKDFKPELDLATQTFILGLSPNASRLSVRFWHTDSLDFFLKKIAQHYQDLELDPLPWKTPPSVSLLLLETAPIKVKERKEKIPSHLAGEVMRAILSGGNYPRSLLGSVIMRMRADGDISKLRVALCKAVITRSNRNLANKKEDIPVSLDMSVANDGYLLGRWFAELERTQRYAIKKEEKEPNTTIKDQFYGSASANPATTFPTLIRKYQNHITKLGKNKKWLAINIEKTIGEIVDKLPAEFPKTLSMEDQGRFAIGYYHQRQEQFKKKAKPAADEE